VLPDTAAAREKETGVQPGNFFKRLDDLPDIIILTKRPILATYICIAGKNPSFFRLVKTNMIRAVPRGVNDLKSMM